MSPLLLLPYFWISLYGSRRQLALATIIVAAVLTLPILLIGSPHYPPIEWRRAIIWLSIVPVMGHTVRELVERVERLARTDSLTGALNRRAWDDELERAIARARRLDEPLTLALLDIDYFKTYNDTHGHLAGDELLRTTVEARMGPTRDSHQLHASSRRGPVQRQAHRSESNHARIAVEVGNASRRCLRLTAGW